MEQDHRGIKQRYYPMRGFGAFASVARFCRAFEQLKQVQPTTRAIWGLSPDTTVPTSGENDGYTY